MKIDFIRAGISPDLSEAAAAIEFWLPAALKALKNPTAPIEYTPQPLQRLLATLRKISFDVI